MRHSTGADGDAARATGESYPLPTKLKQDVAGSATDVSSTNPLYVQSIVPAAAGNEVTWVRGTLAPSAIAVPEPLAANNTWVRTVTIFAQKARAAGAAVANATSVFLDGAGLTTNDAQQVELPPGTSITFTAPDGKVIDLNDIYVDSTTIADGVFFLGMR